MNRKVKRLTVDLRMFNHSGIGTYLQNLAPKIISSQNYRLNLLCKYDNVKEFHNNAVPTMSLSPIDCPIYSISEQLQMGFKTAGNKGVFWSPHYNIPVTFRGKLLVTVHDVAHLALDEFTNSLLKRLYANFMFAMVRRKADAVIFVSEFSRKEFLRLVGPPKASYVIHNGISERWFYLKKTRNPHPKPFMIFIGNVKPNKNVVRLLDAYRRILNQIPHDLVIIGQKEGFITGDPMIKECTRNNETRIHFTGYVSKDLLEQYYTHADFLVFPSLYEGFGFPPLEAMAAGIPTITSCAASLPEICGDATLYCDPYNVDDMAEKILTMAGNGDLKTQLIHKGRRQAKYFSWDRCARETMEVIDNLYHER